MLKLVLLVALGAGAFLITSCGGPEQFTRGEYDDLSEQRLLDDKFNETDMKIIADALAESLVNSSIITSAKKPPIVMVTMTKNRTQEHIDMKSLTDKMRVALQRTGKLAFTDKSLRESIAEEVEYQQSAYVDPSTARKLGKQIGANYFLTGEVTDRVQQVGDKKYIYYKATFNLVDIDTAVIRWADEKEMRKFYKKRSVRP